VLLETGIIGGERRAAGVSCYSAFSPDGSDVYTREDDRGLGGYGFPPAGRASSRVFFSEYISLWMTEFRVGSPWDFLESCQGCGALHFCDVLYDMGHFWGLGANVGSARSLGIGHNKTEYGREECLADSGIGGWINELREKVFCVCRYHG
jgi:hypothetical protein